MTREKSVNILSMIFFSLQFLLSVGILLLSTRNTIAYAEKLSRSYKISPLIIGTTVVAIGTSLPELVIGLSAIISGDRSLAMGNIIGSNVVNVFLVLPVAIILGNIRIGTTKTQINAMILGITTIVFIIFQLSSFPNIVSGFLFLIAACVISVVEYKMGLFGREHEDIDLFKFFKKERFTFQDMGILLLSILGVIIGGVSTVDATLKISLVTGLSTTALGLSLTAIATSLPELTVAVASRKKEREKLSIGNILGSNIYNLLLVVGLLNIFSQSHVLFTREWGYLAVSTTALLAVVGYYRGKVISAVVAMPLLISFFLYMWYLFV